MNHITRNDAIRWQTSKSIQDSADFCAIAYKIFKILTFHFFYIEHLGQGRGVSIHNDAIRWQISASINVAARMFTLTNRFRYINLKKC